MMRRTWMAAALGMALGACTGEAGGGPDGSVGPGTGQPNTLCVTDEDCTAGKRCLGGMCSDTQCTNREQCAAGQVCAAGVCAVPDMGQGCTTTQSCAAPYVCDGFTHRCYDPLSQTYYGSGSSSAGTSASQEGSSSQEAGSTAEPPSSGPQAGSSGSQVSSAPVRSSSLVVHSSSMAMPSTSRVVSSSSVRSSSRAASSSGSSGTWSSSRPLSSSNANPTLVDLNGWRVENLKTGNAVVFQDLQVPKGTVVIISGGASQTSFESRWNVTLPPSVMFLQGDSTFPGDLAGASWSLSQGTQIKDGATLVGQPGNSYQRARVSNVDQSSAWQVGDAVTQATPGTTLLTPQDVGIFISEWSDASRSNRIFLEIYVNP